MTKSDGSDSRRAPAATAGDLVKGTDACLERLFAGADPAAEAAGLGLDPGVIEGLRANLLRIRDAAAAAARAGPAASEGPP